MRMKNVRYMLYQSNMRPFIFQWVHGIYTGKNGANFNCIVLGIKAQKVLTVAEGVQDVDNSYTPQTKI